ncbi:response regulator [Paenibacillus yanchengensis]|uniref:Response regulator n=1 Tax=Paenibacillus yanchengensis TaxID=2035833 RepID=A0ABW4YQ42_9BACL
MDTTQLCRVLIVDDEVLTRQGIRHFIDWEQEGFLIVGEAANGKEAIELIEEVHPHIVITDIVMPLMDGEALTKEIKERFANIEVIVLSSFGEFDYVRSTFQSGVADYILKPKLEKQHLLTVLRSTIQRIPALSELNGESALFDRLYVQRLLEAMVNGYDFDYATNAEQLEKFFPYDCYCVVGIEHKISDEKTLPLLEIWQQFIAEKGWEDETVAYSLPFQRSRSEAIVVCANSNVIDEHFVEFANVADQHQSNSYMVEYIRGNKGSDDSAVVDTERRTVYSISNRFSSLTELTAAFQTMSKILDYSFYLYEYQSLMEGKLPEHPDVPEPLLLNQLTEDFKRGQFEKAFSDIIRHVHQLSRCYKTDVFEFKTLLGNLIFNITVLLGNLEYDVQTIDQEKYRYFKAFEQSVSAQQALTHFQQFLEKTKQVIASREDRNANDNIRKLMAYIQEHYAEALTLTDLANHFHFNPSYLSNYFSTHNAEGFVDYLHKVRIEKAEQLLAYGEEPISDISSKVGYSDHSYFCKVFKKGTGLSPSQYRRKNRTGYSKG